MKSIAMMAMVAAMGAGVAGAQSSDPQTAALLAQRKVWSSPAAFGKAVCDITNNDHDLLGSFVMASMNPKGVAAMSDMAGGMIPRGSKNWSSAMYDSILSKLNPDAVSSNDDKAFVSAAKSKFKNAFATMIQRSSCSYTVKGKNSVAITYSALTIDDLDFDMDEAMQRVKTDSAATHNVTAVTNQVFSVLEKESKTAPLHRYTMTALMESTKGGMVISERSIKTGFGCATAAFGNPISPSDTVDPYGCKQLQ